MSPAGNGSLTFFSSSKMPSSTPFSSKSTRTALITSWMMWSYTPPTVAFDILMNSDEGDGSWSD